MDFTLRKPCKHCPFRSDREQNHGWLGKERATEISESLHEYAFPCHKTTNRSEDDEFDEVSTTPKYAEQLCYGAAVLMKKEGIFENNRLIKLAKSFNMIAPDKSYEENLPIFDSIEEFVKTHTKKDST